MILTISLGNIARTKAFGYHLMKIKNLIAANWKMNGDVDLVRSMSAELDGANLGEDAADVLICPPATLIGQFQEQVSLTSNANLNIGAQNMSEQDSGAFTGELSANMLKSAGCRYVILGHSERREIFGESSSLVAEKFVQAAKSGLKPVLCVGETLTERESGETNDVLAAQLKAVIDITQSSDWKNAVIAYEPVWAIGTGKTATPEIAQETHEFLRNYLASQGQTANIAPSIQILYGGSMKPENAAELLAQKDINGGLIGGASLDPKSFLSIIEQAK